MLKERDVYVEKFKAQLDQLHARIDVIAATAKADARMRYDQALDQLRSRRDAARNRLDQMRTGSADAWHDFKGGFERSWHALGDSVKHAMERFR